MNDTKVLIASVWIERAEGRADECVERTVDSLAAADAVLREWSETAPATGGYDKCDFKITFADGETYEGRYDLVHWTRELPNLGKHVLNFVGFHAGARCPPHMTEEEYQRALRTFDARGVKRSDYKEFLDKYEIA